MFKTILLPTDGSPLADKAAKTALEFAQMTGGKIIALSVAQPQPLPAMIGGGMMDGGVSVEPVLYQQEVQQAAQAHVDLIAAAARAADIPFESVVALSASPYDEIIKTAEQYHCDLILMATHGRTGLDKWLMGSETDKVLSHTTLPVLVLR
ncbi:MAG TPA: universal stress protein [Janthinobacterium sp.]|jgi:nucleotide-binding universal stress UspA family protein|nr:universal stress protein [Janthinobacterium sp.]